MRGPPLSCIKSQHFIKVMLDSRAVAASIGIIRTFYQAQI
ncbi:hypothetical protein BN1221_00280c [Brenneria goodwinii]|uniref:Uncharacterized protein n=1 Tax=Brenneria goodwinii TaxID=1109412 RepID=A0A0G4JQ44_9GAMM|nr:hypothetical protein BN1221_00280c [Brenneria goodwinii]